MSKKPNSGSALHKVIMVGSGGVGKSAVSWNEQSEKYANFVEHSWHLAEN